MTQKITLARCESVGNLKLYKQHYYVQFYPPIIHEDKVTLCEKGILTLVVPNAMPEPSEESNKTDVTHSYRMVDPAQERLMIIDLIKLLLYHKDFKGELNTFTLAAEANRLQKETVRIGNIILQLHNEPNIDWIKRLN